MSKGSSQSTIWLDRLPTEIILTIFDYLSSNDIIYTFYFLSDRLNNILLQNQRYLNYLELPTTNIYTWTKILSIIASQIQSLNIKTIYLSFPLKYFSNLKSIIISSSYGFPDEELKAIFQSKQFKGGVPPLQHDLKFCQFVGASAKGLNIKYLLGWMRSRGDIRFTKFEKVVFSSYFEGSRKSNSCTVPYSYKTFGKNFVYRNLFTVFNSMG
jgi:hypothetical protein